MPAAAYQYLKWPHRPEWHQNYETFIRTNNPHLFALFKFDVVAKQTRSVLFEIRLLRQELATGHLRHRTCCPNLAMRMRVARPHHLAAILENLHMADPVHGASSENSEV